MSYALLNRGLWIWIRMDPYPGGENLKEKTEKMQGNWYKILIKNKEAQLFLSFAPFFLTISIRH